MSEFPLKWLSFRPQLEKAILGGMPNARISTYLEAVSLGWAPLVVVSSSAWASLATSTFGQPDEEIATRELAGKDPKTTVVVGGETAALGETGHSVFRQASFQCGQYGTFYFPFVSV